MAAKQKGSMEASKWMLKSGKGAVAGGVTQCPSTKRKDREEQSEPASSDQQRAAIDKMLRDAILLKQAQGGVAGPKLTKGEIRSIIALKPEPFPSADYLDEVGEFDPMESIAEKKLQHAKDAAYFASMDEKHEAFRQKVIRGIKEKGYYEVDVEYVLRREKANHYAKHHARNPFDFLSAEERRHHVATPEQTQQWIREGCYGQYVPDKEEELLINCGEDDDSSDAE